MDLKPPGDFPGEKGQIVFSFSFSSHDKKTDSPRAFYKRLLTTSSHSQKTTPQPRRSTPGFFKTQYVVIVLRLQACGVGPSSQAIEEAQRNDECVVVVVVAETHTETDERV